MDENQTAATVETVEVTESNTVPMSSDELDAIVKEYASEPEVTNTQSTESNNSTGNGPSRGNKPFNAWEDFDTLKPLPLPQNVKADGKTFHVKVEKAPDEVFEKIVLILPLLNEKGFTYRSTASTRDPADKFMMNNYFKKKFFLPFKKAGNGVAAETEYPAKKAYQYMLTVDKFFSKAPQTVRSFIANVAHVMLGKNLDQPLDFLLVYTPCGSKTLKGLDFKKTKTMYKEFKIADHYGIPIFNLKDPNCIGDLKEFIKTKYLGNE